MRVFTWIIVLSLGLSEPARADEISRMILLNLDQASAKLRRHLDHASGAARLVETSGTGATAKEIQITLDFQTDAPKVVVHRKSHMESDPSLYLETVQGFDGESIFLIRKEHAAAPFTVSSFRKVLAPAELEHEDFFNPLDRYLFAPVLVSSLTSTQIVQNPHFAVDRIEKLASGDYRLSYRLDDPTLVYGSGWIELGESTGWLIRRSECRLGSLTSKRRCRTDVDYGLTHQSERIPERVTISHQPIIGASFASGAFVLEKLVVAQPPARVFRLSDYGLGDLAQRSRRGSGLSISQICLLAAPLFLLAAIWVRYRTSRQ